MRQCKFCGGPFEPASHHPNQKYCYDRQCFLDRERARYQKDGEMMRAYEREHYKKNPEPIKAQARAYRAINGTAIAMRSRVRYEKNKEAVIARVNRYDETHRPERLARQRVWAHIKTLLGTMGEKPDLKNRGEHTKMVLKSLAKLRIMDHDSHPSQAYVIRRLWAAGLDVDEIQEHTSFARDHICRVTKPFRG